jgi:hypothetical protein
MNSSARKRLLVSLTLGLAVPVTLASCGVLGGAASLVEANIQKACPQVSDIHVRSIGSYESRESVAVSFKFHGHKYGMKANPTKNAAGNWSSAGFNDCSVISGG